MLNWLFFFILFKCTERQEEWKMFVALKLLISKIHLLLSKQGLHKLSKKLCTKRLSKTFNHTFETMKSKRRIFCVIIVSTLGAIFNLMSRLLKYFA